jgi:ATP-dependent Lon protease
MTSGKDEFAEIDHKIKRTKLSKEAREKARHELSSLIRKAVKELTLHNKQSITVEANTVADYLGVPKLRSLGTPEDGDLGSRAANRRSPRSSLSIVR